MERELPNSVKKKAFTMLMLAEHGCDITNTNCLLKDHYKNTVIMVIAVEFLQEDDLHREETLCLKDTLQ